MLATTLTTCSGYNNSPSAPTAPAGSTTVTIASGAFTQTTTAFGQNPLTIAAGISWFNNDTTTHTSTADSNQWSSGNIPPGGRFNFTFASAGRFTYHCQIHPNMVGTIVVQ